MYASMYFRIMLHFTRVFPNSKNENKDCYINQGIKLLANVM